MFLSIPHHGADLHHKHTSQFLRDGVLPFLRRQVRIQVQQLFARHEVNHVRQVVHCLGILVPDLVFHVLDDLENRFHVLLQRGDIPFAPADDFLPVPLIHIRRVEIVQLLVLADRIHVRVQPFMQAESIAAQGCALPLRQRMHDLHLFAVLARHGEMHRFLAAVEVIVETGTACHEQRRGDPLQLQLPPQFILERVPDVFDGFLGLADVQGRFVVLRYDQIHLCFPRCFLTMV